MKNLIKLLIVTLSVVAFSCAGDSPETVAKQFMEHFKNQDYEKAKELGTENTKKMIDFIAGMQSLSAGTEDSTANEMEGAVMKDFKCEEVATDTVSCTYKIEQDGEVSESTIDLVKQDGKWLVDMKKE
jgi:ATP phosphoribosyltransferase regulatory subunit HisZ